ncbi:MAG TPA: agmatine deiminase family protein [Flavobacteriales bacterium]|nr:agmatine deiminase family protein [Flavobacteriales bacterium]HMR26152.1 agmatine deiminase family protein [Flavobacteriales bacterium]
MRYRPLLFVVLFAACSSPRKEAPEHTLPPEWAPHEAVWFTYTGIAIDTVLDRMLMELDTTTLAVCVIDGDSIAQRIRARWDSLGIAPDRYRVEIAVDSLLSPVVRDAGPIFLRKPDGTLAVLDADWNYYGDLDNLVGSPDHLLAFEDSFPTMLARRMGLPVVHSDLVIEGGAVEVNGAGVLLQVEAVTMQRNPGWSRDSMEHELKRVLGVRDIIWLKEGPADDMWYLEPRIHGNVFNQGTGGHVDEFCRFVNDSTVLLAWPDEADLTDSVQLITGQRMDVNLRILERFRDREGRALNIIKVPTPDTEFHDHVLTSRRSYDRMLMMRYEDLHEGDSIRYIPAASYLNFLITNGRVFAPAYWHEGKPSSMKEKDARVLEVLNKLFPDRSVVQVDPRAINWRGGGVHCWTQQQPLVKE